MLVIVTVCTTDRLQRRLSNKRRTQIIKNLINAAPFIRGNTVFLFIGFGFGCRRLGSGVRERWGLLVWKGGWPELQVKQKSAIWPFFVYCLSVCLIVCLIFVLAACFFVCLFVWFFFLFFLSVCLFVCFLAVCLSGFFCLFGSLTVCLSVCLYECVSE